MRNFWLIAKHEYRKMVSRRSFLVGTLGIPLLIIIIMGIGIVSSVLGGDNKPVGYVDQADFLDAERLAVVEEYEDTVAIRPYPDEIAARAALESGDIQAYYVVPPDYLQNQRVSLFFWEDPPSAVVQSDFDDFLRANLVVNLPEQVQQRILEGSNLTIRAMDGGREVSRNNFINFLLPFAAGFFFIFTVMSSAGYLLQVVTDEKENRTIEIMVTSVTPGQLIGGKATGLMGVALTQMGIWLLTVLVGVFIASRFMPQLSAVSAPWGFLLIVALFFLPAYALMAGLMTAIGGAVTELQQGQQIAGVLNLLFVVPFFFAALVFAAPDSPILVGLTLFPTTSFVTIALRWGAGNVPLGQMVLSWVILATTAVLSVWASSRIFRAGMLRYGQRLSLRGMVRAVRTGQ